MIAFPIKALVAGASTLALTFGISCGERAFEGGIRNVTTIALDSNPFDETYLGGVFDSGVLAYVNPTGGSSGTADSFSGVTSSADGSDDHTDAITNSAWNLTMNWSDADDACIDPNLQGQSDAPVGSSGAIFRWHCLL